ncbi:MAG: DUF4097 domain-containing protein [Acidobacteriota bacterium]|nr:DUF4097 domain-containing protein [Acidobacteriota bacterium]
MRRTFAIAFAAALALGTASARPLERQIIGAEHDHSAAAAGDCEHFYTTTFTSFVSQVHDQEQRELDLSGVSQISVASAPEGGLSVRGWNRPGARLVICRYAVANTRDQAKRVLGSISISSHNGEIAAFGPPMDLTQAWWVNMILYVPKHASLDVRAANGGVAIRNMSGRVTARATAGGISVAQSTGKYRISTETGGITLDRVSGLVDANSRGGAIAFKVAGTDVPTLDAKTADGQIRCTLKNCDDDSFSADGNHLRLGDGVPDVRLSSDAGLIWIGPVTY